ncbi:MAG TPA: ABC transporter permease [Kiloniellales bacterium]|nr:ABC transporter permease [Kiloniellales bacterium]
MARAEAITETTARGEEARGGPTEATAEDVPLKVRLKRAERRRKLTALALVAPLLLFLLVVFIVPIGQMMWRSVENPQIGNALPRTIEALAEWEAGEELPGEEVFAALHADFMADQELPRGEQTIGSLAVRLNYEISGARSAVSRTARQVEDFSPPYKEAFLDAHRHWGNPEIWRVIQRESRPLTASYYVAALDREYAADGTIQLRSEQQRIYIPLFLRTFMLSAIILALTFLLGFPISYYMSILPMRYANLLMICVLLPFWTSLLVRTTAWIVLLQQQGVLNSLLVRTGLISDENRLSMIYNMTGTIIAMTHILLPFMVLPLYSVMRGIPPSYMRAAKGLGASPWTAFRRVYFPQTLPGIGAGGVLVFIISIGYYITPALVGGQSGRMISNEIARHMQQSLNWGLAAALATLLLVSVLVLYWVYNRLVGADSLKFG